jgi:hypothetical protein
VENPAEEREVAQVLLERDRPSQDCAAGARCRPSHRSRRHGG